MNLDEMPAVQENSLYLERWLKAPVQEGTGNRFRAETTIAFHGNRMVRLNPQGTEIIDLDQQSITIIDHDKHNYSVMTFQQI